MAVSGRVEVHLGCLKKVVQIMEGFRSTDTLARQFSLLSRFHETIRASAG